MGKKPPLTAISRTKCAEIPTRSDQRPRRSSLKNLQASRRRCSDGALRSMNPCFMTATISRDSGETKSTCRISSLSTNEAVISGFARVRVHALLFEDAFAAFPFIEKPPSRFPVDRSSNDCSMSRIGTQRRSVGLRCAEVVRQRLLPEAPLQPDQTYVEPRLH